MSTQGDPQHRPEPADPAYQSPPQQPQTPPPGGLPTYSAPSYPQGGSAPAAPAGPPPAPLALAVKLMYAGAALSVLGIVAGVTGTGSVRDRLEEQGTLTSSAIDTAVSVTVVFAIVGGLIGVALWILMAVFNGRGAQWARIVATVLGGISVLSAVSLLVQTVPPFTLVVGLLQVVLAVVILVLLWRPASSAYYRARSNRTLQA
ncbi:hypothetical protein GCM10028814_00700 [Angustibacter aerolatus]